MPYRTCQESEVVACRSAMSGGPDSESVDAGFVEGDSLVARQQPGESACMLHAGLGNQSMMAKAVV